EPAPQPAPVPDPVGDPAPPAAPPPPPAPGPAPAPAPVVRPSDTLPRRGGSRVTLPARQPGVPGRRSVRTPRRGVRAVTATAAEPVRRQTQGRWVSSPFTAGVRRARPLGSKAASPRAWTPRSDVGDASPAAASPAHGRGRLLGGLGGVALCALVL